MGKKWMILLCSFSVLTLICSIISTSLIFYGDRARTQENSNKVIANNNVYKNATIVYEQDNNLSLYGLTPGIKITQNFSMTNNNSNTIKYSIKWLNVTTTWNGNTLNYSEIHPEEFVYTLTCSNGEKIDRKQMPLENEYIIQNLELKTNKSNNCSIDIEFLNMNKDQSYNYNKSFSGRYLITIEE